MKTTLSPESQHDSAGSRVSQNIIFSVFFEVPRLSGLLGLSFSDFFRIFSDFGHPLAHHFGILLPTQNTMQNGVSKNRGRRQGGEKAWRCGKTTFGRAKPS